jgi:predicted RNA binding protein YcfA (HicA-like mRNA interferase family)
MGERFPICSANDVIRVLRRNDFVKVGQKGSHQKWRHADGRQVIVADHGSKPIPIGTLKSIIAGAKLSVEEFR